MSGSEAALMAVEDWVWAKGYTPVLRMDWRPDAIERASHCDTCEGPLVLATSGVNGWESLLPIGQHAFCQVRACEHCERAWAYRMSAMVEDELKADGKWAFDEDVPTIPWPADPDRSDLRARL
jgi:hypothetical protein